MCLYTRDCAHSVLSSNGQGGFYVLCVEFCLLVCFKTQMCLSSMMASNTTATQLIMLSK